MPANRFEVLECRAAIDAAEAGAQDAVAAAPGALDVLAQHVLGTACAAPFDPDALYRRSALGAALRRRSRARSSTASSISSSTGGYALQGLRALRPAEARQATAVCACRNPRLAQQYRMNVGTIVEAPMIKIRLVGRARGRQRRARGRGGRVLGEVEEYFVEQLAARRHVRLRRRGAALRRPAGHRSLRHPRRGARTR